MSVTKQQVAALYAAVFNRAPDQAGLDFWEGSDSFAVMAAGFVEHPVFVDEYGDLDNQAFVEAIYENVLLGQGDAEGIEFWVGALDAGLSRGEFLASFIDAALNYDGDDADALLRQQALENKVTVGLYYTETLGEATNFPADADIGSADIVDSPVYQKAAAAIENVTADPETVEAAKAEIDREAEGNGPEGNVYWLTDGRDVLVGTDGDDEFIGLVGQNQNGAISNAFSTGDYIDGGAGRDAVFATVMSDQEVDSGTSATINPMTRNVEEVHLEALNLGAGTGDIGFGRGTVRVDAGRMDSVEEFWSDNSSATLYLNDVRLGSKLSVTKDITFGLRDVDADAGLIAAFESQSLKNEGVSNVNSQVLVRVADVSTATPATPLANVNLDLGFTLGGESVLLEDIQSTDGSYGGLREAIEAALAEKGLSNLVVSFGESYNQVTVANNTVTLPFTAQEIYITDPAGEVFSGVTFDYSSVDPVSDEFLVAGNAAPVAPGTLGSLIETNLVLDNAGRGSTAGDVIIGGMSNSDIVIEKLNLQVDRSSSIDELSTGTGLRSLFTAETVAFDQIEVTSGDAKGDLNINEIGDVKSFDATAFEGENLAVGATLSSAAAYVYNTGDANTTLDVDVVDDVAAHKDFSLSINSGEGDDVITLDLGLADPASIFSAGHNPLINQKQLANAAINAGDGDNIVWTPGAGDVFIQTGSGNDVIYTDNTGAQFSPISNEEKAVFVFNTVDGNRGIDNILGNSDNPDSSLANGVPQTYDAFKLTVQVDFKGIESAFVEVEYNDDYTTTTAQINQAIIQAINEHPELQHLLEAEVDRGEALVVRSLIDGAMTQGDLEVNLIAPVAAVAGETPTARAIREAQGQQTVSAADLTASGLTVSEIEANTGAVAELYDTEFATTTSGDQPGTYVQTLDVTAIAAADSGFFAGDAANSLNVGGVTVDLAAGEDQAQIATKIANAVNATSLENAILNNKILTIGGQEFWAGAVATGAEVEFTLTPTTAVPFGTVPAAISITAQRGSEDGYLSTTEPGVGFTTSGAFTGGDGVSTAQVSTFNFAGVKIDPIIGTNLRFDFAGAPTATPPFDPADVVVAIPEGAGEIQIANLVADAFAGIGATATVNGAQVNVVFPSQPGTGNPGDPVRIEGAYGVTTVTVDNPDAVIDGTVPTSVAPSTSFSATDNTAVTGTINQSINFSGWEITQAGQIEVLDGAVSVPLAAGLNDVAVAAAVHAALTVPGIPGVTVTPLADGSTTVSYALVGGTYTGDVPNTATNADPLLGAVYAVEFVPATAATEAVITINLAGITLDALGNEVIALNVDGNPVTFSTGYTTVATDTPTGVVAGLDGQTVTIGGEDFNVGFDAGAPEVLVLTAQTAGALTTPPTAVQITVDGNPDGAGVITNGTDAIGVLASKTGSVGDIDVDPYAPTGPLSDWALDGEDSISETDNWIVSGSGDDVIVLSTGEYSNEVIELQGVFGKTLIVNFDDTAVARTNGGDYLDFTDYLNESGAAIEVVSGNANGNKVSIIDFNQLQGTDAGDLAVSANMVDVSGADLAAAINANFTVTGQNVFLINNDNATDAFDNVGEYLVVSTNGSTNIQIVGTLDFGAEINDLSAANLIQF